MLAAVHPSPAINFPLSQALATGSGSVSVGRVEPNVVSVIRLNLDAGGQVPDKLVNMVSRQHARLEVVAGHLQVVDLGAVNGTFVNDQRLESGSTRVLQDGDVISFGGPTTLLIRGEPTSNPWVWRLHELHQFLAAYVPPGQGPPPGAASPAAAAAGGARQSEGLAAHAPSREVFRFSPGPPAHAGTTGGLQQLEDQPPAAAAASPGSSGEEAPTGASGEEEASPGGSGSREEEEAVVSPEPAPGGSAHPGSTPVQQETPVGDAQMEAGGAEQATGGAGQAAGVEEQAAGDVEHGTGDSDDSAALDLAALEHYLASQQASGPGNPAPAPALAGPVAASRAPPPAAPAALPGVDPAGSGTLGAAVPPPQLPNGVPTVLAAEPLPPGAMPVRGAAQPLPPGAMPVQGPTQPLPAAAAASPAVPPAALWPGLQLAATAEPASAPQQRNVLPPALQVPAPLPAAGPDLVDLTGDSPPPVTSRRQRAAQHAFGRAAAGDSGGAGPSGAAAAAAAATAAGPSSGVVPPVEFVDLACSPTKRRHGEAEAASQEAKRARPSPEARPKLHKGGSSAASASAAAGASGSGSAAAAAAAAAPAGPAAAGAAGTAPDLSSMFQELTCAICQEMLVASHTMYPCNHPFCGECLAGWLSKGKRDCPNCRVKGTAAPTRAHHTDSIAAMFAKSLSADDQESRQQKQQSWEANRERLEGELAAPWARGGGSGGGGGCERSGSGRGGGGDLMGLAAAILGGGGPLAALGAPFFDPLMLGAADLAHYGGGGGPQYGGGGAARRRGAAVPHRAPPPAPPPLQAPHRRNEFKVEVAPQLTTARCAGCSAGIGENTTRMGVRPAGAGVFRWYHLACLPQALWREAADHGVANLRHIPARDAAYVRERMRPSR